MMSAPRLAASSSARVCTAGPSSSIWCSSWMMDCWVVEACAVAAGSTARAAAAAVTTRAARRRVSLIRDIPTPRPDGSCGQGGSGHGGETLRDLVPVHGVPPGLQVLRALVLVLQVVGVLPHVDAQQRRLALGDRVVLVGRADHGQAGAVVDQRRPAP